MSSVSAAALVAPAMARGAAAVDDAERFSSSMGNGSAAADHLQLLHDSPEEDDPNQQQRRPRRKNVAISCSRCRDGHKACSMERPCTRCIRLGYTDCKDAVLVKPHNASSKPPVTGSAGGLGAGVSAARGLSNAGSGGSGDAAGKHARPSNRGLGVDQAKRHSSSGSSASASATPAALPYPEIQARLRELQAMGANVRLRAVSVARDGPGSDVMLMLEDDTAPVPPGASAAFAALSNTAAASIPSLPLQDLLEHATSSMTIGTAVQGTTAYPAAHYTAAAATTTTTPITTTTTSTSTPTNSDNNNGTAAAGGPHHPNQSLQEALAGLYSMPGVSLATSMMIMADALAAQDGPNPYDMLTPNSAATFDSMSTPSTTTTATTGQEQQYQHPQQQQQQQHSSGFGKGVDPFSALSAPPSASAPTASPFQSFLNSLSSSGAAGLATALDPLGYARQAAFSSSLDAANSDDLPFDTLSLKASSETSSGANLADSGMQFIALLDDDEAALLQSSLASGVLSHNPLSALPDMVVDATHPHPPGAISQAPVAMPNASFTAATSGGAGQEFSPANYLAHELVSHPKQHLPFSHLLRQLQQRESQRMLEPAPQPPSGQRQPSGLEPISPTASSSLASSPSSTDAADENDRRLTIPRIPRPIPYISENELRCKNVFVFMPDFQGDPVTDFLKGSSRKTRALIQRSESAFGVTSELSSSLISRPSSPISDLSSSSKDGRCVKVLCADQAWFQAGDISVQRLLALLADMRKTILMYRSNKRNPALRQSLMTGVRESLLLWERIRPKFFSSGAIPRYVPGGGVDERGMAWPSCVWDINAQVIDANDALCKLSGYSFQEIIEDLRMLCSLLDTRDAALAALCHLVSVHSRVAYYECSFTLLTRSGFSARIRLKVHIVRSEPDGIYLRSVGYFHLE